MTVKSSVLSLLILILHAGCGAWGDEGGTKKPKDVARFAGDYRGTYDGADTGTWEVHVDPQGKITGNAHTAIDIAIAGALDPSGMISMAAGSTDFGAVFHGSIDDGFHVSGTWANAVTPDVQEGTFTGRRAAAPESVSARGAN